MMNDNLDIKIIKNYQMIKKVGKGAYGQVWKCVNKRNGIVCGLKRICDGFRNVTDCQRTYRQIMYLKQLDHPNIIKLYNYEKSYNERDMYIQLEFVESDLANVLKNQYLKVAQKQYIFAQIAASIYYLHSGNLLHRDIKPSNVLIGVNCEAKLCDFGLIRYLNTADPENNGDLTDNIATRWYKAPELLLSSSNYGKQIDIWSLGCLLAELYLEKPLFQGSSTFNQLQKIIEITGIPHIQRISKIIKSQTSIAVLKSFINDIPQNEMSKKQSQYSYNQSTAKSRSASSFVEAQSYSLSENHKRLLSIIPKIGEYSGEYQQNILLDLLTKLLQFDPRKRCTIEDVMKHPFLDKFRSKVEWKKIKEKIKVKYENKKLSVAQYKYLLSWQEKPKQFLYEEKKKIFIKRTPEKDRKNTKKYETGRAVMNKNQAFQSGSDKQIKSKIQIEKNRKIKERNAQIEEQQRKVSPKPKSSTYNYTFTPYLIQPSFSVTQKKIEEKSSIDLSKNGEEKAKIICPSKSKEQLKQIKTMYIKTQMSSPSAKNDVYWGKGGYFQGKSQKSVQQNKSQKKSISKISNKSSKSKISNVSGYNRLRLVQNNKTNAFGKNQFVYPSNDIHDVENSYQNSRELTQENDIPHVENQSDKQTLNFHGSVINSSSSKFSYNTIENPVKMNKNPNIIYYPPCGNLAKVKNEANKNTYISSQQIIGKVQQDKMKKSAPAQDIFRKSIHPNPFLEKQIKLNIQQYSSPQKNNLVYVPPQIKTTRPIQMPISPQVAQRNTYIHINQIPARKQMVQNKLNSNYFQISHIPNRSKFLTQQNSIQSIQSIGSKDSQNFRESLQKKVHFQDLPGFSIGQSSKAFPQIRNYSQLNNNSTNNHYPLSNNNKNYNPDILEQQPLLLRQQASIKSTSSFSSINSFTEINQKNFQNQAKLQSKRGSTESFYDKPQENGQSCQNKQPPQFYVQPYKQNFISYQNSPSSIVQGNFVQARYFIPTNPNNPPSFNKISYVSNQQHSQQFSQKAIMSTPLLPPSTQFQVFNRQNTNSVHINNIQSATFNNNIKNGQRLNSPNSGMVLNNPNPSFFK